MSKIDCLIASTSADIVGSCQYPRKMTNDCRPSELCREIKIFK